MTDNETAATRDAVIDLAARVIHGAISTEFGLTPGGEPAVVDVAAARELARRGLLVPVELFEDRERERAELRQARSDYQQRNRQLFERTAQRDKAMRERGLLLWLHAETAWQRDQARDQFLDHYNATTGQLDRIRELETALRERTAERNHLKAHVDRLRFEIENTTLPVGALQAMSDAVNLAHPVSEEDEDIDVPHTELRARRAMDLVYEWLRAIRAIPATLQGDQPAEPDLAVQRMNEFADERDRLLTRLGALERWLRPEVVVGWIQPTGYRQRYLAEDVIRGLLAGDPIADAPSAVDSGDHVMADGTRFKVWHCPRTSPDQ